jgi:hypothetical protein
VWFVDPKSGETLEQKYRETIAGSGTVSSDAILVERTVKSLPSSTFSSTDYTATLGFDVGQQLPTAKTTPIPAPISTGTNWIWPEVPRVETPIQTAKRFARVALGWNTPTVDANAGPAGPTFVTIVQSGHSPLRVLVIPGAGGTQRLQQIGDGVGTTSTGLALAFATYPEATSADIVSRPDGSLRAWRSTAPVPGQNAQAGSNAKAGGSVLILFRDGAGNVVGANGEVIGG